MIRHVQSYFSRRNASLIISEMSENSAVENKLDYTYLKHIHIRCYQ